MNRSVAQLSQLGLLGLAAATFIAGLALGNDEVALCAVGLSALVCVSLPLQFSRRPLDLFEPIMLVVLATILGTAARAPFLAYSDSPRVDFLLDSEPLSLVLKHSGWLMAGLFALSAAYALTPWRISLERASLLRRSSWSRRRVVLVAMASAVVSMLAALAFISSADIDLSDVASISRKRQVVLEAEAAGKVYTALGHLRLLARLAELGFYSLLIWMLRKGEAISGRFGVLLCLLAAVTFVVPVLASSRSGIVVLIFNTLIILFHRNRLSARQIVIGVVMTLAISIFMGALRDMPRADGTEALRFETPVEAIVGSGNFVPVARTSIIIDRVPDRLDYYQGSTYLWWIPGLVPRVLWPEKPRISLGPVVRAEIYGMRTAANGFPPGLLAEGYMNFGYLGMIIVPALFGGILRIFYNSFRPLIRESDGALLLYVGLLWPLGLKAVGLNWSMTMLQCAGIVVVSVGLLALLGRDTRLEAGRSVGGLAAAAKARR